MTQSRFYFYAARLAYIAGVYVTIFTCIILAMTAMSGNAKASTGQLKYSRDLVKQMVITESQANGIVPPALALAVAKVESDFQAHVESHAGARGVMQIMPTTARGEFGVKAQKLWDPQLNISLGIRYLEQLYRQYGNRWDMALSHYNGGTIKGNNPHSYTKKYVSDVMHHWRKFQRSEIILALGEGMDNVSHKIKKANNGKKRDNTMTQRLAADYWLLDDPKVEKNWREYLQIADRWLNHDANGLPEGYNDFLPYDSVGESFDQKSTLRQRFQQSLGRIENTIDGNASKRFM